ncbi:hypothetical protein Malapachy_3886 [Malassezia pachydermatis]|uniref:Uncharacterized protein n=1 Tax=Malassezia pachydermatis TaxID=77020 RepID=A0A0M9VPE1_9BASI|nr:hypothetical protein Malapachy_3886 [Malassezia pachydermatis]KOS14155.1 hypothetical protein Malapachy_3886 [Malassezia pachydermatis]
MYVTGSSSNLIEKLDTPAHDEVRRLVAEDAQSRGGTNSSFTLDGERGTSQSQLCRILPNGQEQCANIALEARDLFQTMQTLGFFCVLPQEPTKTFIRCEYIPK